LKSIGQEQAKKHPIHTKRNRIEQYNKEESAISIAPSIINFLITYFIVILVIDLFMNIIFVIFTILV
jgi:hypothetical protein